MALKLENQVLTVVGNTNLSLTPRSGEAIRVKDIFIYNPSTSYLTVSISQTTVGYFRVSGTLGNHAPFPIADEENSSVIGLLRALGLMDGYPVAQGETLNFSGVAQANAIQCVIYDVYDAADIQNTMPDGSNASIRNYLIYGKYSGTLATGDNTLSVASNPSQFSAFPFGVLCPDGRKCTIKAIFASDVAKDTAAGTNQQKTNYLKLTKNEEFLFDVVNLAGIPLFGITFTATTTNVGLGCSVPGNYSDVDRRPPMVLPQPLEFVGGDKLMVQLNTTLVTGAANIAALDAEVAFLVEMQKL